ncbi:MAG: PAC2 family protein [Acidimicrobiia bacterium]|nr:PAC2 family protein [Acidimicrobiia bacterium]
MTRRVGVAAFSGWGDAGESSTNALHALLEAFPAVHVATIESERFVDFQVHRPLVSLDETGVRELTWPDSNVWIVQEPSQEFVVVTGHEPNFGWKAFVEELLGHFADLGVDRLVTLGAFAGQVPHTAPVPMIGSGTDLGEIEALDLVSSSYEGPTGIVGVLNALAAHAGLSVLSIWAAVPHYLSTQDYPPGALALLEKLNSVLDIAVDTAAYFESAAAYRRDVDAAVSQSEIKEYVQGLEAESLTGDSDADPAGQLVEEIERYLNDG